MPKRINSKFIYMNILLSAIGIKLVRSLIKAF